MKEINSRDALRITGNASTTLKRFCNSNFATLVLNF